MTVERQSALMSSGPHSDEARLLAAASRGDREAFAHLGEPYRRELRLHCYRMLGSFHEAEDLVQDTYLRAWRSVSHFEGRASFRTWLYRIATNACLNVLAARAPRIMPESRGAASDARPGPTPATEVPWLEPFPDAALEGLADARPGPDARYALRESVQLAFVAAIQHLPPRQRAALLLHDVLGWSAAEIAHLLATSVAAVNSALQRARATLDRERPGDHMPATADWDRGQDALLHRYLQAWEASDADSFAAMLRDDAVMSMPPWPEWYRGRAAIRAFFAWTSRPGGHGPFRLVATRANAQPAFAFYSRGLGAPEWRAHSLQLVGAHDGAITYIASFVTGSLVTACGLPYVLPD